MYNRIITKLPLDKNILLDRFTCALLTPLTALPACYLLEHGYKGEYLLAMLSVVTTILTSWNHILTIHVMEIPGTKIVSVWISKHRMKDPMVRIGVGPLLRMYNEANLSPHGSIRVGSRFTVYFAQGDPYFHALTERSEWEVF